MEKTKLVCAKCKKFVDCLKADKSTNYKGICLVCYERKR